MVLFKGSRGRSEEEMGMSQVYSDAGAWVPSGRLDVPTNRAKLVTNRIPHKLKGKT